MDPTLRKSIYALLLAVATASLLGRIANVELLYEPSLYKAYPKRTWPTTPPTPSPSFGSNDRARWATVKAIVEDGTFVIGERIMDPAAPKGYRDEGILFPGIKGYGSVDVVLDPVNLKFYGTKPPLLTVLVAGQYWVLHRVFGKNIDDHRWEVVVPILIATNVIPLVIALWLLVLLLERYGTTDWGRLFIFASACFGTFLTTFAVTLNNHVPASCCVMFTAYLLIGRDGASASPVRMILAGLFAGVAVSLDHPAAAFAAAGALIVARVSRRNAILYAAAVAVPLVAQTVINYYAIGTWEPIYAKFGGPWYKYEGSHWAKADGPEKPEGIDFADEPKWLYARNLLVAHHGLFSLTPIWLLAVAGLFYRFRRDAEADWLHRLTPLIALVVIGFYVVRTNNYGGWTSGPRWLFWLSPLFLVAMIPAVDRLAGWRWGRIVSYICLAASAFSATYPWANPWRHPWLYQWSESMGWVKY